MKQGHLYDMVCSSWRRYSPFMAGFYFTYILSNGYRGTLYTGVTNNLLRRVYEHQEGVVPGFSKRYGLDKLVWFEPHTSIEAAISREKSIKRWKRVWKFELIERDNPDWNDLSSTLAD